MKQMDEQWCDRNIPEDFNFWRKCQVNEFSLYEVVAFRDRAFMVVIIDSFLGRQEAFFCEIGSTISQEQIEQKREIIHRWFDDRSFSKLREIAKDRGVNVSGRTRKAFCDALADDVRQRLTQSQVSK